jgi:hypothetical protein
MGWKIINPSLLSPSQKTIKTQLVEAQTWTPPHINKLPWLGWSAYAVSSAQSKKLCLQR